MRYPIITVCCLASFSAHANVLQYFAGISYSNPAELFKVKKNEVIIGGSGFYIDARFSGSVLNFNTFQYGNGSSDSKRVSLLPYGRIAKRVDSKMVFAVDITEPFHSNLVWGARDFTRYASTETLMTDVDVSPRFSYSITPKLYAGGGLNFNFLKNNETNWALPISPTQSSTLINRTAGFGVGYNTGLYYMINQTNFFGLAYYASIKQKTKGESLLNGMVNPNLQFNFRMPATTIINYVHIFNPKWLVSLQAFRTEWNANQFAKIRNTAAPPPIGPDFTFVMKYDPSWAFAGALRRQMSEKLGLTFIAIQDNGPEQDRLRTINFPSDTIYFGGLAADYRIGKNATVELLYARVFSKTLFNNTVNVNNQPIPFTTGRVRIHADVVDLRLKIQA
ncbi:hypothetical protein DIZ81_01095 [Legionella taurinensis]|uniref:Aromatic hydrocarbon degradation protein n=1 Tax=Legionella taurinensis TaxID=70611 RepID=A0A3A5LLJ5_9GAMM|nr:outer membrane protein transport protein [Legionella taurinensis]MDX1836527.1 outer membrane protein transport protein [Legionella taurinensis]PUT43153.1 hypothetical protein DB744_01100 [Legionella taurinensis]PUT45175.1 hypothetical protein DB743_07450 [Legionella taurinensis]PUT45563.1 hypothetical protein DB746_01100 [Legionella taurinensis]PUT49330.1 hypothetical protein DB745_01100 [Legionella taurinensis]